MYLFTQKVSFEEGKWLFTGDLHGGFLVFVSSKCSGKTQLIESTIFTSNCFCWAKSSNNWRFRLEGGN